MIILFIVFILLVLSLVLVMLLFGVLFEVIILLLVLLRSLDDFICSDGLIMLRFLMCLRLCLSFIDRLRVRWRRVRRLRDWKVLMLFCLMLLRVRLLLGLVYMFFWFYLLFDIDDYCVVFEFLGYLYIGYFKVVIFNRYLVDQYQGKFIFCFDDINFFKEEVCLFFICVFV